MLKGKINYNILVKTYFSNKTKYAYSYKKFYNKIVVKKAPMQRLNIMSFRKKKLKNN